MFRRLVCFGLSTLFLGSGANVALAWDDRVESDSTALSIWPDESGAGVGFGYENGSWGGSWAQGIRVKIPVVPHLSIGVRGLMVNTPRPADDRWDFGGRLELLGESRVLLNTFRLYGGGGVQLFHPVSDEPDPGVQVGGGGHFGFEFFMAHHLAFFIEVGGQSGIGDGPTTGDIATGATVMAGLTVYPF